MSTPLTLDQLEAAPVGHVIYDCEGDPLWKYPEGWSYMSDPDRIELTPFTSEFLMTYYAPHTASRTASSSRTRYLCECCGKEMTR